MGKLKNEKPAKARRVTSSTPKSNKVSTEDDSLNTSDGSVSNPSQAGVESPKIKKR